MRSTNRKNPPVDVLVNFETVPKPVVDLLEDRLDAALQIIAVLLLTDPQLAKVYPEQPAGYRQDWTRNLRESLLRDRAQLAAELVRHQPAMGAGTADNPLRALRDGPVDYTALRQAYQTLGRLLVAYAQGEGPGIPFQQQAAEWTRRLRNLGYPADVVAWVMEHGGGAHIAMATLERPE
jgi:hypothetical protein